MLPRLSPLPLERVRVPFDDARHVYELKYDGFRALAFKERLSDFRYEGLDALKIRKRGLYCTKDTFVTTTLMLPQGANIA